ncbi:MAG: hypothetical protein WBI07_17780 [Mobilitalea sp.]
MSKEDLISRLQSKPDLDLLVEQAKTEPGMISELIDIVNTESSSIKYVGSKIIRFVSEHNPSIVYPFFNDIEKFLHNSNSFIKWDGILTIANLVRADTQGKFEPIYSFYFELLKDPQMITAGNVISGIGKILESRPQYEEDITNRLLAIPKVTYYNKGEPSPECNNIQCGHVIECFDLYYQQSGSKEAMIKFAENQLGNSRKQVVKKAEAFIKKYR